MGKLKCLHDSMYKLCADFRYAGCDNVLLLTTVSGKLYSSS